MAGDRHPKPDGADDFPARGGGQDVVCTAGHPKRGGRAQRFHGAGCGQHGGSGEGNLRGNLPADEAPRADDGVYPGRGKTGKQDCPAAEISERKVLAGNCGPSGLQPAYGVSPAPHGYTRAGTNVA